MKIAIGSDHAGFRYKGLIIGWLREAGHDVDDFGTNSTESVDYPLFIRPVAEAVAIGDYERGIVLGGSANGEANVANRIRGIRCTICWNVDAARFARAHNDSNVLSLGERLIPEEDAATDIFDYLAYALPSKGCGTSSASKRFDGLADDSAKERHRPRAGSVASRVLLPRE